MNQKQVKQLLATEANIRELYLANAAERSLKGSLPSWGAIWDGPTVFMIPMGSAGLQVCPLAYPDPGLAPGLVLPPGSHQIKAWFRVESAPDAGWYELQQDVSIGDTSDARQLSLTAVDVLGLGRVRANSRTVSPTLVTVVRREVSQYSNSCAVLPRADVQAELQRRVQRQSRFEHQFVTLNQGLERVAEERGARISEALREVAVDAAHDALAKAAVRFPQPPKGPGRGVAKRGEQIRPSVSLYGYVMREVKKQIDLAKKEYLEQKEAAEAAGYEYLQLSFDVLPENALPASTGPDASAEHASFVVEQLRFHLECAGQRQQPMRTLKDAMERNLDDEHKPLTKKRLEHLKAIAQQLGLSA